MSYPLSRKNAEIIMITLGYTARAAGEALDRAHRTGRATVRYHRITWDLAGYQVRSAMSGEASAALRLILAVTGLSYAEAITAVRDPDSSTDLDENAAVSCLHSRHGYSPSLSRWAAQAAITAPDHVIFLDRHRVHCDEGTYDVYRRDDATDARILAARNPFSTPEDKAPDDWPDLAGGYDVTEILAALRVVDEHLDEATSQAYRDNPLANMWRRITKVMAEAGEVWEELSLATGENPRKGTDPAAGERILAELADVAVAALGGIQSQTKDTAVTWAVFLAALAKALARVPRDRPAPGSSGEEIALDARRAGQEADHGR